ncbi:MAG TPA: type II toxin-antitoxin system VapC family toxin [Fodinibius sp.]|nr:type II toxin-antitoxin system VapC family toxin [Fodinibius sp.]
MKDFVIDASVAIKWLFLEKGSVQAEKLLEEFSFFFVPDLFFIELDAVITKKVRQRKIEVKTAMHKIQQVRKLPYKAVNYNNISSLSCELATSLSVTLYDATYLATAIENHGVLYTADQRLVNCVINTTLDEYIKSIWEEG